MGLVVFSSLLLERKNVRMFPCRSHCYSMSVDEPIPSLCGLQRSPLKSSFTFLLYCLSNDSRRLNNQRIDRNQAGRQASNMRLEGQQSELHARSQFGHASSLLRSFANLMRNFSISFYFSIFSLIPFETVERRGSGRTQAGRLVVGRTLNLAKCCTVPN